MGVVLNVGLQGHFKLRVTSVYAREWPRSCCSEFLFDFQWALGPAF